MLGAHREYRWLLLTITLLLATTGGAVRLGAPREDQAGAATYIVQAQTAEQAAAAVTRAGGRVTYELPIVHGVAATLGAGARQRLAAERAVTLSADTRVYASAADTRDQVEVT